jgi:EAL domain-containing protein (putative c-di-GMP-specific phosphodiesterase class I)
MLCPNCETIPTALNGDHTLFLWPPLGHTQGKLRAVSATGDWITHDSECQALVVDLPARVRVERIEALCGVLTDREAEDTRALVVPAESRRPGLSDFAGVTGLRRLAGSIRAGWLTEVLAGGRLTSFYQPIFRTGATDAAPFAYEALLRGRDPEGAIIPAGRIIDAATQGDMLFMTDLEARMSAVDNFGAVDSDIKLFINFSPNAVYDPVYCLRRTIERIETRNLSPDRIVFELIESERHTNLTHLASILRHYRGHGFGIAIDDFGAGYNGFAVIEAVVPDIVKLDMALVQNVHREPRKQAIVSHVIALCQNLGSAILAEGIEDEADLDWVASAGVDYVQGYLFGRPAPFPANAA